MATASTKVFTTTNGTTFKVDSKNASVIKGFGDVCFMVNGDRRYLRSSKTGKYLARAIAERAHGDIAGKKVSFKDGNPLNLTEKNLLVL